MTTAKVLIPQVFMGWLWFIPTFHMPHPPPSSTAPSYPTTKFMLTRKELDFPLGVGSGIIDVGISLEWFRETDTEAVQPRALQIAEEGIVEGSNEPALIAATVQAFVAGSTGDTVEAKQGAED
jgi:phosphatidylinositol-3,4,5-trisphosphate 3-phosphatase/dual-specificity protein phosphatase PTEN